ncbi:TRAP transporter substrate-binding protein DctP [Antarctobacter sp.]|uniref:TRAP transporter substrate-binding protein DctP n=1 Tax=Antarctobacter sp. TaxID=1872577 RepID=UPI003A8F5FBD
MKSICLATLLTGLAATTATAETLILSTNNSPTHFTTKHAIEPFMACVKERSGGELDFNFFPSSQIASAKASVDSINDGLAHVSYVVVTSNSDKLPIANISVLPGMGSSVKGMVDAWRKVITDGGPMKDELDENHIVPLTVHMYPPYQLGLTGEKLDSIEDFAGLKLRVAGGAQVFAVNSLGAVPVQISAGDAYVAMQNGTVDGYMLAVTSIDSYSLQEVSGSITSNGAFAGAAAFIGMNDAYLASLSEDKQAALRECGLKIEEELAVFQDTLVEEMNVKFAEAGAEIYELSDETLAALNQTLELAVKDYVDRLTELGMPAQEALEQYRAALTE